MEKQKENPILPSFAGKGEIMEPVNLGEGGVNDNTEPTTPQTSFYKKMRKMKYACFIQCATVCSVFFFLILDIVMKFIEAKTNSILTKRIEEMDSFCQGENCTSKLNL